MKIVLIAIPVLIFYLIFAVKRRLRGIYFKDTGVCWKISTPKNIPLFIKEIPNLLPDGSNLFLEGPRSDQSLNFCENRSLTNYPEVRRGTIFPLLPAFHVAASADNIEKLSSIAEAKPEISTHFGGYKDNEVLLHWHDAFLTFGTEEPLFISKRIPKEKVERFCEKLNLKYIEHSFHK